MNQPCQQFWCGFVSDLVWAACVLNRWWSNHIKSLSQQFFALLCLGWDWDPHICPSLMWWHQPKGGFMMIKGLLFKNFLAPDSQVLKFKIILGWLKAQYLLPSEVITFKHGGKLHLSTSLKCYWKCKEMLCRAIQYHFRPSFKKLYFRKWFCMGDRSQSSLAVRFTAKSGGYLFPWNE